MKYRKIWIIITVLTAAILQAQTLDLNSFLNQVKEHSKDLKLASKQQELAAVQKLEALTTALPKIVAQADYTRNLTSFYMFADMEALTGQPGVVKLKIKRDNEF